MFDLDTWFMPQNRSDAQKEIQAIELPYKCGRIEAEIIAARFINHEKPENYLIVQPKQGGFL
jgi:hypothetical protein